MTKLNNAFLKRWSRIILVVLISISCKSGDDAEVAQVVDQIQTQLADTTPSVGEEPTCKPISAKVIIDDLRWDDPAMLSDDDWIRKNSKAVGSITIPAKRSRCTGFLINEDTIITNNHCISDEREAKDVSVVFNREDGVDKDDYESFTCETFLGSTYLLDMALIKCNGKPGAKYGYVTLNDSPIADHLSGDDIYVLQQNCDYISNSRCNYTKKYADGEILYVSSSRISYDADTLGGSSGSPVFSYEDHRVIGLHNSGSTTRMQNNSIPMSEITKHIREFYPEVEIRTDHTQTANPDTPDEDDPYAGLPPCE